MTSGPEPKPAGGSTCARCGGAFACGMLEGVEQCWCASLPPLAPVAGRACLCPACLRGELRDELAAAAAGRP